jgi:hypothetical protein
MVDESKSCAVSSAPKPLPPVSLLNASNDLIVSLIQVVSK